VKAKLGITIPQVVTRRVLLHVDVLQESPAPLYGRQACALVMYGHRYLLFPIVSNSLIPAHWHPSLTFADQIETRITSRLSFLIHSQEYQ